MKFLIDMPLSPEAVHALEKERIPLCLMKDRYRLSQKLAHIKAKWEKGEDVAFALLRFMEKIEHSVQIRNFRMANVPALSYPVKMPVLEKKNEILKAVQKFPVTIIAGETGCGKTSQIPKICIEAGRGREGKIGCTQPRRVAATSIARYLATQVHGDPRAVAYQIRFHSTDTPYAYVKFMTDGILLSELKDDRYLAQYDTLIIDEAHERTLNIDFILGYLKKILMRREDLKVIISSATMDTESFSKFFDNAPVIEVSGRTYPVLVVHRPLDRELEDAGDCTIIDMAVDSAAELAEAADGDILIFMPTEADIRETVERLRGGAFRNTVVLPLFSRLTMEEQNRIFQSTSQTKIIVATNIAETSLTIPGIRYVIDTGYARMSRYCPRTRTKRLPIEPISRSSAEQRKGRCGRMEEGICIRLYSEEDFEAREKFTAPEIKRSDLAEVILRMLYLRLGDIATFPFIDPPSKNAIRAGFDALREVGALTEDHRLTPLGKLMAQMPTDPRTARILLAGEEKGALREILIIAAALSIQDPRERPFEKQREADEKHAQFAHRESDFMTYLILWDKYHDRWDELKTQNKMRKFCRIHFLSYPRMREWCDLHEELKECMKDLGKARLNLRPANYEAIHQAILSGFLGNIACKDEKNLYQARNNQEVMIFPGSGLYKREPEWIVAAEMIETSRLFARTVAQIDVAWIEPLAGDLCQYTYHEPQWDRSSGQVIAYEKVTLWGLVIAKRRVHYGKIARKEAREIFIREGLVPGEIAVSFPFLEANQKLIASVRDMENKIRRRNLLVEDYELAEFYNERLPDVVNLVELREYLKEHGDSRLFMGMENALRPEVGDMSREAYPDHLWLGSQKLPLTYHFQPDDPEDGITLKVPRDTLAQLKPEPFDWLVPGWLLEKITALLKSLPKDLRKQLVPLNEKAKYIEANLKRTYNSLITALQDFLRENYQLKVKEEDWDIGALPSYLFMRFAVIAKNGEIIASGRDLKSLQEKLATDDVNALWRRAHQKWFLPNLKNWCFDSLPESVEISPAKGGIPHSGYPGLEVKEGKVNRSLFPSLSEAEHNTREALAMLLEFSLAEELARLRRALSLPAEITKVWQSTGWVQDLSEESFLCLKRSLLYSEGIIRRAEQFAQKRKEIQDILLDIVPLWITLLTEIVRQYREVEREIQKPAWREAKNTLKQTVAEVRGDLRQLLFPQFLSTTLLSRLQHYPRYLKGILIRLERALVDPLRDRKRADEYKPYLEKLKDAQLCIEENDFHGRQLIVEYRWLLEEWKISLFAQELKTACPVSPKRLGQKWDEIVERMRYQKPVIPQE